MNNIVDFSTFCQRCEGTGWLIERRQTGYGAKNYSNQHTTCHDCRGAGRKTVLVSPEIPFTAYMDRTSAIIQGKENARQILRDGSKVHCDEDILLAIEFLLQHGDLYDIEDARKAKDALCDDDTPGRFRGSVSALVTAAAVLVLVWLCLVIVMSIGAAQ